MRGEMEGPRILWDHQEGFGGRVNAVSSHERTGPINAPAQDLQVATRPDGPRQMGIPYEDSLYQVWIADRDRREIRATQRTQLTYEVLSPGMLGGDVDLKREVCTKKARRVGNFWECKECGYREFA
jgi:hypothetical protein